MSRKIITIDEEKCVGCGLCAKACQQSAIEMVNGKAKVVRDDYCDGLGNCLPVCPVSAISFSDVDIKNHEKPNKTMNLGCISNKSQVFEIPSLKAENKKSTEKASELSQWPIQIKLVPEVAGFFDGAKLLIAADCSAFSYGNFHEDFMKNKITIIGCPKLDQGDYTEKLTSIFINNNIKSMSLVRMEVPCCSGLEKAAVTALKNSGKFIPWEIITLSRDGRIIEN